MQFPEQEFDDFCGRQMASEEPYWNSRKSNEAEHHARRPMNLNSNDDQRNRNENTTANENPSEPTSNESVKVLMDTVTALLRQNAEMLSMMQVNQQRTSETNKQGTDVNNFNIMPDLSKSIENFSGELSPRHAVIWIDRVKNTASLYSWPDAFILQTAYTHLVGAAKHWYLGRSSEIKSWTDFEVDFRRTFIFEESQTDAWNRMQRRSQRSNENVSTYFHDKVSLGKACNLQFSEIKEQIAVGLFSEKLSDFILARYHIDEDDLFKDIINYERVHGARKGSKPETNRQGDKRSTIVKSEGHKVKAEHKHTDMS